MITHFKVDGRLACGRHGSNLFSTGEPGRVKCRSCRNTEVFQSARKEMRNAARRASRKLLKVHVKQGWRASWQERLAKMPGLQRLPRGFSGQPYI
ncbi:hypothetical protein ACF8FG_04985 [Pseudomonas sp. YQ_6]|uniref:hypothetical protein n=1 Tax=Pseudomonas TaxID=286 RepID=UPI000878AE06|nr:MULTISPECIES: hypothetical protein [Pseudomonas]AOX09829.1 hypothetical protein Q5O_15935 [Pseudomonas putida JB]MCI1023125.1 hypothetical protein [Pseudomonas putida]MDN4511602.1 hypothetical protein [Pseudomonas sp. 2,4-D]MDW2775294.1 hypothetical protein [Pseudomonas sp. BEA3.1]RIZ40150.1 hypothetical protein CIK02_10950 [Pseudomonas putida]